MTNCPCSIFKLNPYMVISSGGSEEHEIKNKQVIKVFNKNL